MFVGEMGCWLVVFGFYIYKRYVTRKAPLLQGGYEHINDHDSGIDSDNEEMNGSFLAVDSANPVAKSLVANTDGRGELVGWRVILLALPACCDIAGTTLMNVGLLFVAASIYQMTRGALVLFVGIFSVLFLKRKLYLYHWTALFIVVLGVAIVGLAGAIAPNPQAQPDPESVIDNGLLLLRSVAEDVRTTVKSTEALYTVLGVLMIAAAQIFTATQFVLEEWILEQYALEPLKVVGWEGIFGFLVTVIAMIVLHFAIGMTEKGKNGYFDAKEGWREISKSLSSLQPSLRPRQLICHLGRSLHIEYTLTFISAHYRAIAISSILIMVSIGGFNFFGLSVTRSVSATARSTIDTCRTLFIWIVSLGLGWETFKWLQILGFAVLVYGTFLFNDIVSPPLQACIRKRKPEALLAEEPIEHS